MPDKLLSDGEGTWNYRIGRMVDAHNEASYQILEVDYDHDGNVTNVSAEPCTPFGSSPQERLDDPPT